MEPSPQQSQWPQQPGPRQPAPEQLSPEQLSPQQLPPAVVALLLRGGKVTEEVFSRALLSLADDGWLRIEPQDSGGVPVVRIARLPAPAEVKPFEQVALERVVKRMGTLTHVPLSALTSSEGEDYGPWWTRFQEAVKSEARQAGLIASRFRARVSCGVPVALALATSIAVAATSPVSAFAALAAGFGVLVVCGAVVTNLASRLRLTERGEAAAEWWRQRGGGLGGAVLADQLPAGAVPSPHSTEAMIAQGSAPLPDGYVWSSYGDRWRTVKVGSLDVSRWGRPGRGIALGLAGAFLTIPFSLFGRVVGHATGTLISFAPLAVFGSLLLFAWLPACRRSLAIPTRGTFTGQVVKRWTYESGGEDSTTYHCCCIDDGASPEGWAFRIEGSIYAHMRVGDIVYVDFNPRRHKVNQLQLAAPAPGPRD